MLRSLTDGTDLPLFHHADPASGFPERTFRTDQFATLASVTQLVEDQELLAQTDENPVLAEFSALAAASATLT